MEPRREESKVPTSQPADKPKRFRIIKLEERIAPSRGGNGTNNECLTNSCLCGGGSF
jgi:hypothetical protein